MSIKTKTPATQLVEAIHMSYPEVEVGYCIAGYIPGILGVVMSLWDNKQAAEKMLTGSAYHTAIVYNFATDEIVAAHLPEPTDDDAAEREWLAKVQMDHVGYGGQHDEDGARFAMGGVRLGGPSAYEFRVDAGLDATVLYLLFTEELVARWNRGPVE